MKLHRKLFLSTALLAAVLFAAPAAFAHAHPKTMTPAPDSTGPSPVSVTIAFSEAIEPKFSSISVTDEKGKQFNTVPSTPVDATTLTLPLPTLPAGVYVVHWVNVAVDGHRLAGDYKFTVQ